MEGPILELEDVTIAFENEVILTEVNMTIWPKESVVLIGLSGGGKTVLLKTLAGIIQPSKGHSRCYGKQWDQLASLEKHDLARKIGMQFQKGALFDDLTAFENVAYPLREHTVLTQSEIEKRVIECLRAVDLEKAVSLQMHEMSGGMRQRLSIARSIALKPDILFMDDPTAGLDPINSDLMAELILNLKKEIGATLVIVTHDVQRAYQFAGRIFFVGNRTVLEAGSSDQTRQSKDPRIQQYLHGWIQGPLTQGNASF